MEEHVILVDRDDAAIGRAEKTRAHQEGLLHRAFSVFVFDGRGSLLLQRRALTKYHSGGLWSNTCCSHPRPGEGTEEAAHRRLAEEMGFDCPLEHVYRFVYRAPLDHGLQEHEVDHVFFGRFDGEVRGDAAEVLDWRWCSLDAVRQGLAARPGDYTVWFRLAMFALTRAELLEGAPRKARAR
jgi:isopentenyl-diphosphate Delta-isomerase